MNVLYLLNFAGNGGTEVYVKTLVAQLAPHIQPYFIYNESGPLLDWMTERNIPTAQVTMNSPFDRTAAAKLADYCAKWEIDVIHTHFLRENYLAMLAKRSLKQVRPLKVISTFHILTPASTSIRLCNRLISPLQDAMIANCSAGRALLRRNGVPAKKIELIYNAVDPAQWQGGDPTTLRRELSLSDDTFLMLFAARFVSGKGHNFLLDAVRSMSGDFCLALAGSGELEDSVRAYVHELGLGERVRFLGQRSDMKDLYASADVTVCPSESETLSFLLLESLAAGTPVVASQVGGIVDILTPENDCGLSVPYGDVSALTTALSRLQAHPEERVRLSQNGLRAIDEKFHIDRFLARILELYRA